MGPRGADLWYLYMLYLKTTQHSEAKGDFDRLVYDVGMQYHPSFNVLKANVLEFMATTIGIRRARKIYATYSKNHNLALEMHEMMADLESKQV